jgi:aryl-alcohol dehydrogenase-like predicted oxidoreductase
MRGDALQSDLTNTLADELNVAPLGVGAWAWGTSRLWGYGKEYDRSDVGGAFRASMAEGVTLVDTAEIYGNGASERIIGEILREGGFQGRPVVATKVRPPTVPLQRQLPSGRGRQESGATRDRDHRPLSDPLPEPNFQDD